MRRREFITLVGGAAAAWPFSLRAQEAGRTYRIGGMSPSPRSARYNAVVLDELPRFGFIEGQNLTIDWLGYGLNIDPVPEFAAKLVKARVDVILAGGIWPFAPRSMRQQRFRSSRLLTTWSGPDW